MRPLRYAALCLTLSFVTSQVAAQTPAPPDWQDGRGSSAYLSAAEQAQPGDTPVNTERYAVGEQTALPPASAAGPPMSPPMSPPRVMDAVVMPAAHTTAAPADEPQGRRLAPPTAQTAAAPSQPGHLTSGAHRALNIGIPVQSMYTVVTALAVVLGAFLIFAWALRKGGKNSIRRRGSLPSDVVSVLGRVPIAARQFAELLRVGNKLVLVALTPAGPTALTEVTDPIEVDRLVGLCQQVERHSTSKEFEAVFQQFSNEPTAPTFLGDDPLPPSISTAASAYRSHRGIGRV